MACTLNCAKVIFAQIPKEALTTIKEVSAAAKTALSTLKLSKQAIMLNMDVSLVPLTAKRMILEQAISTIRGKTRVIPPELVLQCPQVGAINTLLEASLVGSLEGVSNMIFDIERLQSLKFTLSAEIDQIDIATDFFTEITECIDEVLNS